MCAELKEEEERGSGEKFPLFKVGNFSGPLPASATSPPPPSSWMHKITFFLFLFTIHLTTSANEIYTQLIGAVQY